MTFTNLRTLHIVLSVPSVQALERNLDELMGHFTSLQHLSLMPDPVPEPLWQSVNPEDIVGATSQENPNASDDIGGIPEADIAAGRATCRWVPWHDQQVQIDQYREDDRDMPGLKAVRLGWWWQIELLALKAHKVKSEGHQLVHGKSAMCFEPNVRRRSRPSD